MWRVNTADKTLISIFLLLLGSTFHELVMQRCRDFKRIDMTYKRLSRLYVFATFDQQRLCNR